jgi:hypothetical protein
VREVRGEEEDSCGGGCDGGGGVGGYKEVEIPNEVMGVWGAQRDNVCGIRFTYALWLAVKLVRPRMAIEYPA